MNFSLKNYNTSIFIPFLVILVAGLTVLHQSVLEPIISKIETDQLQTIIEFIGILSVPGMVGIILAVLNQWLWEYIPFLVMVPNISGRYEGKLTSTFEDPNTKKPKQMNLVLEIKQTASSLFISCFVANGRQLSSCSESRFAEISKGRDGFFVLTYGYQNDGSVLDESLNLHRGLTELKFFPDEKELEGAYFSQRKFGGTMKAKFKTKKLKGRY